MTLKDKVPLGHTPKITIFKARAFWYRYEFETARSLGEPSLRFQPIESRSLNNWLSKPSIENGITCPGGDLPAEAAGSRSYSGINGATVQLC